MENIKLKRNNKEYILTKKIKLDGKVIYKFSSMQDNIYCFLENNEYKQIKNKKIINRLNFIINIQTDKI
ncbi:MAG: hypothetical protein ACI4UE_01855 [Candidatus Scatovivens sp.]